jgi:hypothetical protein
MQTHERGRSLGNWFLTVVYYTGILCLYEFTLFWFEGKVPRDGYIRVAITTYLSSIYLSLSRPI